MANSLTLRIHLRHTIYSFRDIKKPLFRKLEFVPDLRDLFLYCRTFRQSNSTFRLKFC